MNIDDCSSPETICLQCGDEGVTDAFVYCVKCLQFAVHRYCLDVIPETFDEFVRWYCDDCEMKRIERRPKSPKEKKLSIDDQINEATLKKFEPQTPDEVAMCDKDVVNDPPTINGQSTMLKYAAMIKNLKKKVSKMKQNKLSQDEKFSKMKSSIAKKSNVIKRLKTIVSETSTVRDELTREMERMKREHEEALALARLEGAKAFKESIAFQECVVVRALDIYEHGFNVCLAQSKRARAFRKGFDASLLDPCKDERLRVRTVVGKEPKIEPEFAQLVD